MASPEAAGAGSRSILSTGGGPAGAGQLGSFFAATRVFAPKRAQLASFDIPGLAAAGVGFREIGFV
jgi:hypothetical protein